MPNRARRFSVRSTGFRWTEWFKYDKEGGAPLWNESAAQELYDHRADEGDGRAFDDFENDMKPPMSRHLGAFGRHELEAHITAFQQPNAISYDHHDHFGASQAADPMFSPGDSDHTFGCQRLSSLMMPPVSPVLNLGSFGLQLPQLNL